MTKISVGGRVDGTSMRYFVYQDWPRQASRKRSCTVRAVPEGRASNPASNVPTSAMVGAWQLVSAGNQRAAIRKSGLSCGRRS